MKALLALMVVFAMSSCASSLSRPSVAEIPDTLSGTWEVTDVRLGGVSAVSVSEAKEWVGRRMTIGTECLSLEGKTMRLHHIVRSKYDAVTYFWEAFRMRPEDVGFRGPVVWEYLLAIGDEDPWIEPGSMIVLVNKTKALAPWEGIFFVLEKRMPNQAPKPTARSAVAHLERSAKHTDGVYHSGR
jgi:hypothetical protein